MEYPVKQAEDWRALEQPSLTERLASRWRDARRRRKARRIPRPTLDLLSASKQPLGETDVILICVGKDAEKHLPSLLSHYRRLGVGRFAFVDDESKDATRAILERATDVDLFRSNATFSQTGGGLLWRDMLVDHYGRNRWYLSIDSDEYLVYPGCEHRPLRDFIADLERRRLMRAHAAMLDIYPEGRLSAISTMPADAGPTETSPLYDSTGYTIRNEKFGTAVRGGPRLRLYGANMRMSKFPLLYADRLTQFASGSHHGPLPLERNFAPVQAVLLHHKFPAGAVDDFRKAASRGTHFGTSAYKTIVAHPEFHENADFRYAHSQRYVGSQHLVDQGFMQDIR